MTPIFGPAEAMAAARCLTARSIADGVTEVHPRKCGWCTEPLGDLRALVEGWNAWAAYEPKGQTGGVAGRHEVRVFAELPRDEQRRQIEDAQQFPPEPLAVQAAPNPPAVAQPPAAPDPPTQPAVEAPSWLVSHT